MKNIENKCIDGFVKRAKEKGFTTEQTIKLLKYAAKKEDHTLRNVLLGLGGAGALGAGAYGLESNPEIAQNALHGLKDFGSKEYEKYKGVPGDMLYKIKQMLGMSQKATPQENTIFPGSTQPVPPTQEQGFDSHMKDYEDTATGASTVPHDDPSKALGPVGFGDENFPGAQPPTDPQKVKDLIEYFNGEHKW